MEKFYLLIAGDHQYPQAADGDWIATFRTFEEAKGEIEDISNSHYGSAIIRGTRYDWWDIIDLKEWIGRNEEGDSK